MMMMFEPKSGWVWGGTYGSAAALGVFVVLFDHLQHLVDEHETRGWLMNTKLVAMRQESMTQNKMK